MSYLKFSNTNKFIAYSDDLEWEIAAEDATHGESYVDCYGNSRIKYPKGGWYLDITKKEWGTRKKYPRESMPGFPKFKLSSKLRVINILAQLGICDNALIEYSERLKQSLGKGLQVIEPWNEYLFLKDQATFERILYPERFAATQLDLNFTPEKSSKTGRFWMFREALEKDYEAYKVKGTYNIRYYVFYNSFISNQDDRSKMPLIMLGLTESSYEEFSNYIEIFKTQVCSLIKNRGYMKVPIDFAKKVCRTHKKEGILVRCDTTELMSEYEKYGFKVFDVSKGLMIYKI